MTQPIDVAWVEVRARTKDFSKDLDRDINESLKKTDVTATDVAESIGKSFAAVGGKVHDAFRDVNKTFDNTRSRVTKVGEEAADVLGNAVSAGAKTATDSVQKLLATFGNMTGIIGQLATSGPVGIAALAAAFAALAVAAGVAAAAIADVVAIATFAGAALPGVITAAVAGFGILAVAFNGVSDAFGELTKKAKSAGGAVSSSERQIAAAQRNVTEAQRNLNKEREEAAERIRDMRIELNRARIEEARAVKNVADAQRALVEARLFGNAQDEAEARLRLAEQQQGLVEAKEKTEDLEQANAKAAKVGVEGDEQVLAAKQRLLAAEDALAAAQQRSAGGAAAQTQAFDSLSKSAQLFVQALVRAKEQLAPVGKAIQEAFFSGTAPLIDPIVKNIQKLQPALVRVSSAFGKIFQEVLKFLGSDAAQKGIDSLLNGLATFLEKITPAIGPLLEAFAGLVGQTGEFGDELGGGVASALGKIADFVKNIDLQALFEDAKTAVQELLPLLKPVLLITLDLFKVFVELGRIAIPPLTIALTILAGAIDGLSKLWIYLLQQVGKVEAFVREKFLSTIGSLVRGFQNLPTTIKALGPRLLEAGRSLITNLFNGLNSAGGYLGNIGKNIANQVINALNNNVIANLNTAVNFLESALNSLPVFNVNLPTIPRIPRLEKGGLVTGNTLAELGEKGKTEAVLPLEDSRAMSRIAGALAAAGAGGVVFNEGAIVLNFEGATPTPAQARALGTAAGQGIAGVLARRAVKTQVRAI